MTKKQDNLTIKLFDKLENFITTDNNENSIVPQCTFTVQEEQDCRQTFINDYDALMEAYMNLQYEYSNLCTQNKTLWTVIQTSIKISCLRSQVLKLRHIESHKPLKRDPMSIKVYKALLKAAKGSRYSKIRLRVAFCILFLTGIKLNVLLSLRVRQLTTLREKGWIAVDEYTIESTDSKGHLTKSGRIYLKEREEDFKSLFSNKTSNDFIFTSERKPDTQLSRETLTREINKVMSRVSQELVENPKITTYSFRVGTITEFWENPNIIKYIQKALDTN